MFKKTITYTDCNGVEKTEDKYFSLSKAETQEWQYSVPGGKAESLKEMVSKMDYPSMLAFLKELILKSYGEKGPDGTFYKEDDNGNPLSRKFKQSEAYSELFMWMTESVDNLMEFITGVFPAEVKAKIEERKNSAE